MSFKKNIEYFNNTQRPRLGFTAYYSFKNLPPINEMFHHPYIDYVFIKVNERWTLLIKHGKKHFEYFDPSAYECPNAVKKRLIEYREQQGYDIIDIAEVGRPFTKDKKYMSGKWCMFRASTLPMPLYRFDRLVNSFDLTPDGLAVMFKFDTEKIE